MISGVLSGILFAVMALALRQTEADLSPFDALFTRSFFFFLLISLSSKSFKFPARSKVLWGRSVFGAFSILIYFRNILELGASPAAVLNSFIPIFVLLASYAIIKEKINKINILGVALIITSELSLKLSNAFSYSMTDIALALIGCAFGGLAYVCLKASVKNSTEEILKHTSFTFMLVTLPFVNFQTITALSLSPSFWLYIVSGLIGHILLIRCFRSQRASLANLWTKPIVIWIAIFESALAIKEHSGKEYLFYFALIAGVYLAGFQYKKQKSKREAKNIAA